MTASVRCRCMPLRSSWQNGVGEHIRRALRSVAATRQSNHQTNETVQRCTPTAGASSSPRLAQHCLVPGPDATSCQIPQLVWSVATYMDQKRWNGQNRVWANLRSAMDDWGPRDRLAAAWRLCCETVVLPPSNRNAQGRCQTKARVMPHPMAHVGRENESRECCRD
jgi:hypothetical protein